MGMKTRELYRAENQVIVRHLLGCVVGRHGPLIQWTCKFLLEIKGSDYCTAIGDDDVKVITASQLLLRSIQGLSTEVH